MYVCVSLVGTHCLEQGGLCMYTCVQYLYENSFIHVSNSITHIYVSISHIYEFPVGKHCLERGELRMYTCFEHLSGIIHVSNACQVFSQGNSF